MRARVTTSSSMWMPPSAAVSSTRDVAPSRPHACHSVSRPDRPRPGLPLAANSVQYDIMLADSPSRPGLWSNMPSKKLCEEAAEHEGDLHPVGRAERRREIVAEHRALLLMRGKIHRNESRQLGLMAMNSATSSRLVPRITGTALWLPVSEKMSSVLIAGST